MNLVVVFLAWFILLIIEDSVSHSMLSIVEVS